MLVSIDAFENDERLAEPSIGERTVAYLAANDDAAFTRGEIAAGIDADPNAVGSALTRLKDRGLVRHRQRHWAITDDRERLRAAYEMHTLLEGLAAAEDESLDREAWLADAIPVEGGRREERDRNGHD